MTDGSENPCPFIRDDLTIADAFGAHDRLAKAIQKAISAETPPRTIGIVEPWGSGKSSVVDMLATRLKAPEDGTQQASTFLFDAWL